MADPNEPVRVLCHDTGHEYTIRRVSLPHGNYEVLAGVPAADPNTGRFLPPKHAARPGPVKAAPESAATDKGQTATIKKESKDD